MKYINSILVTFLIQLVTFAQTEGEDIVHLKNGETIQGTIFEQKPGQYIQVLQMPSGDTVKINLAEIDRMVKLVASHDDIDTVSVEPIQKDENSFVWKDYTVGIHSAFVRANGHAAVDAGISFSKTFNSRTSLGIGVKYLFELYAPEIWSQTVNNDHYIHSLPVVGELRYKLKVSKSKRMGLITSMQLGYAFNFKQTLVQNYDGSNMDIIKVSDGAYVHPEIGWYSLT